MDTYKLKNRAVNLGIVILVIIIGLRIYEYQTKTIASLKEKKEIELKKNDLLVDLRKLGKNLASYRNFLNKKDMPVFMNTLNEVAKETDVKIVGIKPTSQTDVGEYVRYPFELSVICKNYHNLGLFISKIENLPNGIYFVIDSVSLGKVEGTDKKEYELSVFIKLSTFFFKG